MKDDMIPGKVNFLGRRGEHMTRVKRFYTGDVLRDYPGAEITVLNKRPGDTGSYPVAGAYCVMDGDWLEWTVQSGDLATEGFGKCEMRATVNGQIALSIVYTTEVKESLDGAEEPPEPWESWVQDVTDAADRAEAAAQLLENPGAEAVTLEAGSQATAEYEDGTFTFGIPRGPKGEDGADGADGYSPSAVVSKSGGVATVTITDKNGTTSAEIRDGTDGQDGITPAFSIGTVQKGTNAAATITGTPAAPVLNLTLPKGDKGNTGNTGPTGATPEFSIGTVETGAAGSQAAATITGTAEAPVLNLTIPRGNKGETGEVSEAEMTAAIAAASSELKSEIDRKAPCIYQDASGDIVSFADGADGMPLSSCVVQIDPVQTGSGDPSPQNVRSISGHDSATIYDSAVLYEFYRGGIGDNDGQPSSSTNRMRTVEWIPYNGETTLTFIGVGMEPDDRVRRIYWYDSSKTFISSNTLDSGVKQLPYTYSGFTAPTGAAYFRLVMQKSDNTQDISYSGKYLAVNPAAYPVSWQTAAGTVYGGQLDTVTGVLTVDRAKITLTGAEAWQKAGAYDTTYYITRASCGVAQDNDSALCNMYKVGSAIGQDGCMRIGSNSVFFTDSRYTTKDAFAAAVAALYAANTPLEFVGRLETPLTYQLDPVQITTLLGENNLWADTGAVSIEYPADTRTYVDGAIAAATDPDGNVIQVTGSTPSITGESGKRYVCGTVDSISITPPQTGIVDVVFSSGTTPTVLTVPNTVLFPAWFSPSNLSANSTYEINIMDGVYGAVSVWS